MFIFPESFNLPKYSNNHSFLNFSSTQFQREFSVFFSSQSPSVLEELFGEIHVSEEPPGIESLLSVLLRHFPFHSLVSFFLLGGSDCEAPHVVEFVFFRYCVLNKECLDISLYAISTNAIGGTDAISTAFIFNLLQFRPERNFPY